MWLIHTRALLELPDGENGTDSIISGVHFNRTTLDHWNYTLWSNDTLSNVSSCWIVSEKYVPTMLENGTFVNATSCYAPIRAIGTRAELGIVFGVLFGITVMLTLINLRKLGRKYLPAEKRFKPIGRRWQWYWMLVIAACGIISGLTGIDVDRAYLQSTPIILQNFFYFLMMPATLAAVWEGVRHWGSWQERQIYDAAPFSLPQSDRRGRTEFYMPLVFYLFAFLNFFMTIPRSWTQIQFQRSDEQQQDLARPQATDSRFKAGSILSIFAFLVICFSLRFSIHHYKPRSRGLFQSVIGFFRYAPNKFLIVLPLLVVKMGYQIAIAWDWFISPLKSNINSGWMYGLGYAPVLLILIIFEISGFLEENEDKIIIRQRRERGSIADRELGLQKKPDWWRPRSAKGLDSAENRLKALTSLGGGAVTQHNIEQSLELQNMAKATAEEGAKGGKPEAARSRPATADPFSDTERLRDGSPMTISSGSEATQRTVSTSSPQVIRSMLDV